MLLSDDPAAWKTALSQCRWFGKVRDHVFDYGEKPDGGTFQFREVGTMIECVGTHKGKSLSVLTPWKDIEADPDGLAEIVDNEIIRQCSKS